MAKSRKRTEAHPGQPFLLPVEDRLAAGKALRERCTRKSQGRWQAPPHRADPIELLHAADQGKLRHLLPIRYGRMMASPFAFYRGAAALMAADLASTPVTGLKLQACGDCHLLNFGGFATPERKLIFDINDFDESAVSHWEWDVKRLATSFVLAGRANGFDDAQCNEAAWLAARAYRRRMAELAQLSVLEGWYASLDLRELADADPEAFGAPGRLAADDPSGAHGVLLTRPQRDGMPCIAAQPPLIYHADDYHKPGAYRQRVEGAFARYRESLQPVRRRLLDRYRIVDVALKVVGVGAVGTECGVVLLMSGNGDTLALQYKEARASVLEAYSGACPWPNHGQRVVDGQQVMQSASDLFLGWTADPDGSRHYYVRQLRDVKVKPRVEKMRAPSLRHYAEACGRTLARAHARSGDAVTLTGYMGRGEAFEDALTLFAGAYAEQTARDHQALLKAIKAGQVPARREKN